MVSTAAVEFMAVSCRDVTSLNLTDKCEFVRSEPSCAPNMGFVNYMEVIYCLLGPQHYVQSLLLTVTWLLVLFVGLGVTSGDFLTPALFVISKTLHMSQNMAGVTLLAFGNGSPDIFAALAGVRQGSYELVIGGLIGGGIFVTTVVAGSVFLSKPFKLAARPFTRDCVFYFSAAAWAFYLFYTGEITMMHAIGFICLYCVYITVVIVSGIVYQRYLAKEQNRKQRDEEKSCRDEKPSKNEACAVSSEVTFNGRRHVFDDPERSYVVPIAFRYLNTEPRNQVDVAEKDNIVPDPNEGVYYINLGADCLEEEVDVDTLTIVVDKPRRSSKLDKTPCITLEKEEESSTSLVLDVINKLLSVNLDEKEKEPFLMYLVSIFKIPVFFALAITTPVVDLTKKNNNWCRPLNVIHCITVPVFLVFVFGLGKVEIGGVVPLWTVVAAAGALVGVAVLLTSENDKAPKYHFAFAYAGFFVGVVWIYVISMEIVVLLQAVGIVFRISDGILGLTILAWGNGLLDFLANVNIARKGYPRMSISACFGTPCLTLLLGVGIPSIIQLAGTDNVLVLHYTKLITVLFSGLATSLLSSLATMLVTRFQSRRFYGGVLLAIYFTFLVAAVLVESGLV
ncbi:mitochondrial sodium/calcium exchanger protein-like [Dermacentor variabilis]|uniref:mitochondrial sodium/calcium exchanger protein-like n=1 Tax=Dermacentor variabilis TaxID=34621 RepID=UPI003F5B7136